MADLFAELAGVRVEEGTITVPTLGCFHADVTLDGKAPAATSGLVLSVAGLKVTCSPYRPPITFQGKTRIRLIGGYGGWRKVIKAKGYKLSAGVKLSLILGDAAKECGEKISVGDDRVLGNHYARDEAPAMRTLNRWCADTWWIDVDGTTKTGARASTPIASPLTLVSFDGARGIAVVATETPADLVPGRTFKVPTLDATLTIGGVAHSISKGKLRSEVLVA